MIKKLIVKDLSVEFINNKGLAKILRGVSFELDKNETDRLKKINELQSEKNILRGNNIDRTEDTTSNSKIIRRDMRDFGGQF